MTTRRGLTIGLGATGLGAAFGLAACGQQSAPKAPSPTGPKPAVGTLEWAAAGAWRLEPERDVFRHPVQTLNFFGIKPDMTVVEIYPGRGWYTAVIAPFLAKGGGRLIAAGFDPIGADDAQLATLVEFKAKFQNQPRTFGSVDTAPFSARTTMIDPPGDGMADMALVMRNVHTFMAGNFAPQAFKALFNVLKPGGVLGIEEHRAKSTGLQDPQAGTGYVQEEFIKLLAEDAGFKFSGSSEINANPKDTKDHPFGVWTLPPTLRSSPLGAPADPGFDNAKYKAIGESDRMTLKFIKPEDTPDSPP
jgi:predicted methyltransferase